MIKNKGKTKKYLISIIKGDDLMSNNFYNTYGNINIINDKFYTAKYDRVFKSIFCNEEDTRMIKFLLSKILDKEVKEVIFLRNELDVKNISDKSKIVDILALVDNEYVHIELNIVSDNKYTHLRNFIYFSEIFNKKTRRGEVYDYKTQFIHIDLSYGINNEDLITEYYIMSDKKNKYVDNIKIIEFDMDKLKDVKYNEDERFKYLKVLDLNLEELKDLSKGDEFIMEYLEKLKSMNEDGTFKSAMTYEEDQRLMLNTERQIGYEEGIEKEKKEIVLKLNKKNFSLEEIIDITGLSKEEINNIIC